MFCIGFNCDLRWQSFDLFSPLYSNGAILVYDITDEDSFFKVTHSAVYLMVTIKVTCTILFYYNYRCKLCFTRTSNPEKSHNLLM